MLIKAAANVTTMPIIKIDISVVQKADIWNTPLMIFSMNRIVAPSPITANIEAINPCIKAFLRYGFDMCQLDAPMSLAVWMSNLSPDICNRIELAIRIIVITANIIVNTRKMDAILVITEVALFQTSLG